MKTCPQCGHRVDQTHKFCPECGYPFENARQPDDSPHNQSYNRGAQGQGAPPHQNQNQGYYPPPYQEQGYPPSPGYGSYPPPGHPGYRNVNKLGAGLFGILLGGFGAHKFYLGQIGMGIVYLLFCWTGIPSIIGLIEGILYLTMNDYEFMERYARLDRY